MKKKIVAIILPVIIVLLLLSSTIQVQPKITWEEDFEGDTIATLEQDFWDFDGFAWDPLMEVYNESIDHGFSIIDGILRAPNILPISSKSDASSVQLPVGSSFAVSRPRGITR